MGTNPGNPKGTKKEEPRTRIGKKEGKKERKTQVKKKELKVKLGRIVWKE